MKLFRRHLPLLVCCALLSSCSGQARLAPVKGTVTLDGKPLARGVVVFETAGQRPATGAIVDGAIVEVTSYTPGDGAAVGSNRVAISATEDLGPAVVAHPGEKSSPKQNYMAGRSLIPTRYNATATSGLTAEITRGDNVVEFKLTSAPR